MLLLILVTFVLSLHLGYGLSIDKSCNAFDFGSGPQRVTERVSNAMNEAGDMANAAVQAAKDDFSGQEELFKSLFGEAPEESGDSVGYLRDLYARLADVRYNPTAVNLMIFCGDDFVHTVTMDDGSEIFVDTSRLVVRGPDNHVSTVEEAIIDDWRPCGPGVLAYVLDAPDLDSIVICPLGFTGPASDSSAALGITLPDGRQLDSFDSLATTLLHELQHTSLGDQVEDQTLTRTEVSGVLTDGFDEAAQALGWTFDDGEQICYGLTMCVILGKLHPENAVENPDTIMLLALAAFLESGQNGGWAFDALGQGSMP